MYLNMINKLRDELLKWSEGNYRDFLWRNTNDPYAILISEFMLQRTKANQVNITYKWFLKKYPSVYSLYNSDINEVKEILKPLGLNWRSEHFIKSARYIVENCGGKIPANRKEILSIPGVGDYAAGMVLMTGYGLKDWAVDSNIARFFNRYFGLQLEGEIRRKKEIISIAKEYFNFDSPRRSAYAILDFTALVCKDRKPECNMCPVKNNCHYSIN